MLNGPTLSAVTNRYSVLMRDMKGENFEDRLETVYLTMLSRRPTAGEVKVFREAWAADPETAPSPALSGPCSTPAVPLHRVTVTAATAPSSPLDRTLFFPT